MLLLTRLSCLHVALHLSAGVVKLEQLASLSRDLRGQLAAGTQDQGSNVPGLPLAALSLSYSWCT